LENASLFAKHMSSIDYPIQSGRKNRIRMNASIEKKIATRSAVISRVKRDLIQRLSLSYTEEDLHEDASLIGSGLGLDSLDALEIILGIEQEFKVKIEEGNISVLRSINTIVDYILDNQTITSAPTQTVEGGAR